jgi:uncharacterized membrane protein YozB (DUF420 family)
MKKHRFVAFVVGAIVGLMSAVPAFADPEWYDVELPIAPIAAIAIAVFAVLATLFAIRKGGNVVKKM